MISRLRTFAADYVDAYRGLPRDVWLLSFVLLINRCGAMVLPFWAIYCKSERGFSDLQVGQLLSIYGVGSFVGAFVGGWLTTKIGAFRVQWISLILTGLGFLVLMKAQTWSEIAAVLIALSVVSEAIRPATATATANVCPEELHPRAMALNRLAVNLGLSIGPVIGGFLADRNFELLFWCDAVTCIVAGIWFLWLFGYRSHHSDAKPSKTNILQPWLDWRFACFGFFNFVLAVVFFQLLGTYMLYFDEVYGMEKYEIGLAIGINTVTIVLLEMFLVHRVEKLNTLRVVAVGFLLSGVGFCILPFGSGFAWAAVSVVIWTIGEMLSMPLGAAFSASRAKLEQRGSYMGAYSMTYGAAFIIAPLLGAWAYSVDPNLVWYAGLVLTFLATAGTWWLSWQVDESDQLNSGESERDSCANVTGIPWKNRSQCEKINGVIEPERKT